MLEGERGVVEIVLVAAGSMQQQQRRTHRSRSGLEAVNKAEVGGL